VIQIVSGVMRLYIDQDVVVTARLQPLKESIQERTRLLQEEIASRTFEATNLNLYIVSLFTVIFLPLTLITGIFGMNVAGLPWLEDPGGFLWVLGVMAFTLIASLVILYWRRFF
jgi:zinc transporter